MKTFIIITGLLGLIGSIFGYWGLYTESGGKKFDEMAGMIPFGAFYLGILLIFISLTCIGYTLLKNT